MPKKKMWKKLGRYVKEERYTTINSFRQVIQSNIDFTMLWNILVYRASRE